MELRPGLVRPVRAGRAGRTGADGPTRRQVRGPGWRRTSHGFYVPADVDGSVPEQRIVEASVVVPTSYAVTGWAALRWWSGCRWFDGVGVGGDLLPVPVVTATHGVRPQRGIAVSEERVHRADVVIHDGVPVTSPCSALSFEVRRARDLRSAVTWIDLAMYADLVSPQEQAAYVEHQSGWTGVPLHRLALDLAEQNSWSPAETRMRLRWVLDAGLAPPLCNTPLFDRNGQHLGTPDLLDPRSGLIAEYDGADHVRHDRRLGDVKRAATFREHGLEYVTTMAGDTGPKGFVARLLLTYQLAAARAVPVAERTWTLTPPSWWTPTTTVRARRALDADQRARFLRYRAA